MSMLGITEKYYKDSADFWKQAHNEAMHVRDLEEVVATGIRFYDNLIKSNQQADRITLEDLRDLTYYHIHWNSVTATLIECINNMDGEGYNIDKAHDLRRRYQESVSIISQCKKHYDAAERMLTGKGLSLDEATNALQGGN